LGVAVGVVVGVVVLDVVAAMVVPVVFRRGAGQCGADIAYRHLERALDADALVGIEQAPGATGASRRALST